MKTKLFLICIYSFIFSFTAYGQEPVVKINKNKGESLTIKLALRNAGEVTIDWGNGTSTAAEVGTNTSTSGSTSLTNKVGKSGIVSIYAGENKLTFLNIENQNVNALDVSKAEDLKVLSFTNNKLSELDVSNNIYLENLYGPQNSISVLNLKNNSKLQILNCNANALTNIDLSNCKDLKRLTLSNNQLSELDVSNNYSLNMLNVAGNKLSACELDKTFKSLPALSTPSESNNLYIDNNMGVNTCATSIAIEKNWKANAVGNGKGCIE